MNLKKITISKPNIIDNLSENVILLSSYPRSGNTWSINLIEDMLSQNGEKKVIYDIHQVDDLSNKMMENLFSGVIKSHYIASDIKNKVIYIYRNPIDIIPSYFRFHKYQGYAGYNKPYKLNIINYFLNEIIHHWRVALEIYSNSPDKIIFIPYEGLHESPRKFIQMILYFLKCKHINKESIDLIINRNKFDALIQKSSFYSEERNGEVFLKYGVSGSGTKEFSIFQRAWINFYSRSLYSKMAKISYHQSNLLPKV